MMDSLTGDLVFVNNMMDLLTGDLVFVNNMMDLLTGDLVFVNNMMDLLTRDLVVLAVTAFCKTTLFTWKLLLSVLYSHL